MVVVVVATAAHCSHCVQRKRRKKKTEKNNISSAHGDLGHRQVLLILFYLCVFTFLKAMWKFIVCDRELWREANRRRKFHFVSTHTHTHGAKKNEIEAKKKKKCSWLFCCCCFRSIYTQVICGSVGGALKWIFAVNKADLLIGMLTCQQLCAIVATFKICNMYVIKLHWRSIDSFFTCDPTAVRAIYQFMRVEHRWHWCVLCMQ